MAGSYSNGFNDLPPYIYEQFSIPSDKGKSENARISVKFEEPSIIYLEVRRVVEWKEAFTNNKDGSVFFEFSIGPAASLLKSKATVYVWAMEGYVFTGYDSVIKPMNDPKENPTNYIIFEVNFQEPPPGNIVKLQMRSFSIDWPRKERLLNRKSVHFRWFISISHLHFLL